MTGGGEILRDEQIYLAHKCANPAKYPLADSLMDESAREQLARFSPTDVQLQVWEDLCHVAPTLSFTRPAKFMYRSVAQFGAWALARAQKTEIEILDDDDISVISSSEESDSERAAAAQRPKSAETEVHPTIGKAGDPLPPFKNHMIRQRINRHGNVTALEPPSELPACNMLPEEIGVVKEGPVRKWLEARRQWDERFASVQAKVQKQRLKAMAAGRVGFDGETPPPSALAGRRKVGAEKKKGRRRKKSTGMALWSLWGSKHDEATMIREQEADREPETRAATAGEGEGARGPAELDAQSRNIAQHDRPAGNRSRSHRKVVRDDHQTAEDSEADENTPVAELMAKQRQQRQAGADSETEGALESSDYDSEPVTGVTGKRPKVSGIAVPFSLNRDAETASMLTLTSTAEQPSRVVSPMPTPTPGMLDLSFPAWTIDFSEGADGLESESKTPAMGANNAAAAAAATATAAAAATATAVPPPAAVEQGGERPPLESSVTAQEDLPKAK